MCKNAMADQSCSLTSWIKWDQVPSWGTESPEQQWPKDERALFPLHTPRLVGGLKGLSDSTVPSRWRLGMAAGLLLEDGRWMATRTHAHRNRPVKITEGGCHSKYLVPELLVTTATHARMYVNTWSGIIQKASRTQAQESVAHL